MAEGFLIQVVDLLVGLAKGVIMTVFVNWWRNQTMAHINTTVTHERVRVTAEFTGRIPHLTLSWVMVNRSNVNIDIRRIAGELFVGAWRVASFDSDRILESHDSYSWNPLVKARQLHLGKKGDRSEITVSIFPAMEFWLMNVPPFSCSLCHWTATVLFRGGSTLIRVPAEGSLVIEDFDSISAKYLQILRNVSKTKFGDSNGTRQA